MSKTPPKTPPKVGRVERLCPRCGVKKSMPLNRKMCAACLSDRRKISAGEMREPAYSEVNTRGYKEPMLKVEDGYGYYGAITQTNDGKQIQCHICGFYVARLSQHVSMKHKVDVKEYKIKYGLRIKDGLQSPVARLEAQERYNNYIRKNLIKTDFKAMSVKGRTVLKKKGYNPGGRQWSAQRRNERGSCKDQTLAKIKYLGKKNGVVTQKALSEVYGQGTIDTVNHWFGSWANAIKEAGVTDYKAKVRAQRSDTRKLVLKQIKRFYKQHARTPQWADFNSSDDLSSLDAVQTIFGTLNMARYAAEVPLLVGNGRRWHEVPVGEEEEWMLSGRTTSKVRGAL